MYITAKCHQHLLCANILPKRAVLTYKYTDTWQIQKNKQLIFSNVLRFHTVCCRSVEGFLRVKTFVYVCMWLKHCMHNTVPVYLCTYIYIFFLCFFAALHSCTLISSNLLKMLRIRTVRTAYS